MRNPNQLRRHTIPYAIYQLCLNNPQGLTGEQVFESLCRRPSVRTTAAHDRMPDHIKNTTFSDMATSRHLLKMCETEVFLYREKRRNPISNRMCFYYFAKPSAANAIRPNYIVDIETSNPLLSNFPILITDHQDSLVTDEPEVIVEQADSLETLEAEVWKCIVNHKPMSVVNKAYQRVLDYLAQNQN